MRRKHAAAIVLSYFDKQDATNFDEQLLEALKVFRDMKNETRGLYWGEEKIHSAIKDFITENGRPPKVKELDTINGLPPHPSIELQFNMTAGEWLFENYPTNTSHSRVRYKNYTEKQFVELFKEQYEKINPASKTRYNSDRDKTTPTWQYIAKRLGLSKWTELKEYCGISEQQQEPKKYIVINNI